MRIEPLRGKKFWYLAALCLAVVQGGCAKLVPAEGVVTLDGAPVTRAVISLFPEEGGKGYAPAGPSDDDGKFYILTKTDTGVRPGKYKVTVEKVGFMGVKGRPLTTATGKALVPPDYGNAEKTPIHIEVPRGGIKTLEIKMVSPGLRNKPLKKD